MSLSAHENTSSDRVSALAIQLGEYEREDDDERKDEALIGDSLSWMISNYEYVTYHGDVPDDWYDRVPVYVQKKLENVKELIISGSIGARAFQNALFKLDILDIQGSVGVDAFKYAYGSIDDLSFKTLDQTSWNDCDLVVDAMCIDKVTGTQSFLVARSIYLTTVDEVKFIKWAQEILLESFERTLDLTNLKCVNRVDFSDCDESKPPFKIIYSSNSEQKTLDEGKEEDDEDSSDILSLSSSDQDEDGTKIFYSNEIGEWFRPQEKTLTIVCHQPMILGSRIEKRVQEDLMRCFIDIFYDGRYLFNGDKIRGSLQQFYWEGLVFSYNNDVTTRSGRLEYRVKCSDNVKMIAFTWHLKIITPPLIVEAESNEDESKEEESNEESKEEESKDESKEEESREKRKEVKEIGKERNNLFLYIVVVPSLILGFVRSLEYFE